MLHTEFSFLISGFFLGLGSGLTPGPLLTLVFSQTLKFGVKDGIKVSIAPLFTDLPIIIGTILILARFSDVKPALGIISILGAIFITYLALELFSYKSHDLDEKRINPHSIKKGMFTNFLNPNPYMFWFTVGAPLIVKAYNTGVTPVLFFILSFYSLLVGSKIIIVILIGRSRHFITTRYYTYSMRFLGIVMGLFAVLFIWNGMKYFGLV